MEGFFEFSKQLGTMFYLVNPQRLWYDKVSDVPNFTTKAIPFFFFLMGVEAAILCARGYKACYFKDTIMSISLGMVQQIVSIWGKALSIVPYIYLFNNFRIYDIPTHSYWSYIGMMLACDLGYYWFHRFAHEYHILWSGHSVHHSGQHYNLATALRQGATQPLFSWAIYLPVAILGFPPSIFVAHTQLNTLFQFWIHTELCGKLGPLELILNTPSHHRMHHRPPGNCNYAGVFIIWDRLFGTFRVEDHQIAWYGLAKPLNSFDPLRANMEHWSRMIDNQRKPKDVTNSVLYYISRICSVAMSKRIAHKFELRPEVFYTNSDLVTQSIVSSWRLPQPAVESIVPTNGKSIIDGKEVFSVYAGAPINILQRLYIVVHFLLNMALFLVIVFNVCEIANFPLLFASVYLIFSMSILGRLSDNPCATRIQNLEVFRCSVLIWILYAFGFFVPNLEIPPVICGSLSCVMFTFWYNCINNFLDK